MEYPEVNFAGKILIASFLFKDVIVLMEEQKVLIDDNELDLEYTHFQYVMEWMFTNDYAGLHRCIPSDYCLDPWIVVRRRIIDEFMKRVHQDTIQTLQG